MHKNVVSNTDRLRYFNGFPKRFQSQKLSFGRSRFSLETLKYFDGKLWKKSANLQNFQINAVRVFVFLYVLFVFISYLNAQVFLQIRRCQLCRSFFLYSLVKLKIGPWIIQQNGKINCNRQMEMSLRQV